jgi:hypothetical protein
MEFHVTFKINYLNMKLILKLSLAGLFLMSFVWRQNFTEKRYKGLVDSTIKLDTTLSLIKDTGYELVVAHCTGCHSSKLITNYKADKTGWKERIRWMQKTQKLWDLGEAEPVVLEYLAKNYGPVKKQARREPLKNINWYKLEN